VPTEIERLYREHRTRLVRLVERELRDHNDAEDVVQTAFIAAQGALERGTIPRDPRAWLATIALNAARRLRRRRLNAEPLEEYAAQEALGVSEIRAALASLPMEQRAAVLYRDLLGLSYGETAEQMHTSVNAVTMLLHRGRKRLRQTLGVTTGVLGLWRWLKRAGMPQVAVAKGAAAVVVAGGLATAGTVAAGTAAQAVAPVKSDMPIAPATRPERLTTAAVRSPSAEPTRGSSPRQATTSSGSQVIAAPASTQAVSRDSTPAVSRPSTTPTTPSTSVIRVPTIVVSTPQIPTLPVKVPATVTVVTPIATATVTTPVATTPIATTVTVTTPLTTVTVPVP
jgi:RNA polymerase sigma-70 factor (ECF subfamily)